MPVTYVLPVQTGADAMASDPVGDAMFGGIFKKHDQLDGTYGDKIATLGLTHIRFPGGTQAEQADWYGLHHPDLVAQVLDDNGDGIQDLAGLTDVMAYANAHGLGLTVIMPTARYADDPSGGAADYTNFVNDLASGAFGPPLTHLTLEIGNEYFAQPQFSAHADPGLTKFQTESVRAESYGQLAARLTIALDDALAHTGLDANISVQGGRAYAYHDDLIRDAFEQTGAIDAVDKVVLHDFPWTYEAADDDIDHQQQVIQSWEDAAGGRDLHLSVSATNVSSREAADGHADWGAAQAPALVNLMAAHIVAGADEAAFYGVQNAGGAALSNWEGDGDLTAGGQAVRLMAETLPGMRALDVSNQDQDNTPFRLDAFEDDSKIVLFASANDLVSGDGVLEVDLQGLGANPGHIWAERVVTAQDGSATTEKFIPASGGNSVTLQLDQPDQLVRIIVAKADPGDADLTLWGDAQDDDMVGGGGWDVFQAGAGDDSLHGRGGHDVLIGGAGRDRISGGDSFDRLGGWAGNDILRGGAGRDRIYGGDGDDDLRGNRGMDILAGGAGDDILTGGARPDRFQIGEHGGMDRITDFEMGSDRVELLDGLTERDVTVAGYNDDGLLLNIGHNSQVLLQNSDEKDFQDAIDDGNFFL